MKYFVLHVNKSCFLLAALIAFLYACNPQGTTPDVNKNDQNILDTAVSVGNDSLQFFKATGNEPFWSLEINAKKDIHFKTPEGIDFYTPVVAAQLLETGVSKYESNTEKGTLIVTLQKGECIDDMSGFKSGYRVFVDIKTKADTSFARYRGCGKYIKK